MPKSTKAAPPQQASLREMWGKKKPKTEEQDVKMEVKEESENMELDPVEQATAGMQKEYAWLASDLTRRSQYLGQLSTTWYMILLRIN